VGFLVPNDFVVGYGIDYNEHFRDFSHVCVLNKLAVAEFRLDEETVAGSPVKP
jgi:hypoxanthine phosphoribosyltransferase